jgi:hypothetical protein
MKMQRSHASFLQHKILLLHVCQMIMVQLASLSKLDQWLRALRSLATIHFALRISGPPCLVTIDSSGSRRLG